jgi:hypothetical protein
LLLGNPADIQKYETTPSLFLACPLEFVSGRQCAIFQELRTRTAVIRLSNPRTTGQHLLHTASTTCNTNICCKQFKSATQVHRNSIECEVL